MYFKLYVAISACFSVFILNAPFTAKAQCLPPDTSFVFVDPTATTAQANWIPATNANSYEYYIGVYPSTPSGGISTIYTHANLTGLTPNATYSICVRSVCSTGKSAWRCDSFSAVASCNGTSGVTVTASTAHTGIASWDPVFGAIAYDYSLTLSSQPPIVLTGTTTNTSIPLTGLKSSGTYSFCVRPKCSSSVSVWACDTMATPKALTVDELDNDGISIYPNPVKNHLHIEANKNDMVSILLTDMYGKVIFLSSEMTGVRDIDLTGFASGLYILTYETPSGIKKSRKIQKL